MQCSHIDMTVTLIWATPPVQSTTMLGAKAIFSIALFSHLPSFKMSSNKLKTRNDYTTCMEPYKQVTNSQKEINA